MGIRTTNLDQSALVDELLGNYNGSTVRVSLLWLLAALTALQGPSYATFAELEGDLDWPNGSQGYVTGDETPEHDGRYRKDGAAGTGTWTRIGDLPIGGPNQAMFNLLVEKVDLLSVTNAVDLDALVAEVASLNSALVLKGGWDASAGTFPGGSAARAGHLYIVTGAGTVDGIAFEPDDRVIALTDNASLNAYSGNWLRQAYNDQVVSVAGRSGAVTLAPTDIVGLVTNLNDKDAAIAANANAAVNTANALSAEVLARAAETAERVRSQAALPVIAGEIASLETADGKVFAAFDYDSAQQASRLRGHLTVNDKLKQGINWRGIAPRLFDGRVWISHETAFDETGVERFIGGVTASGHRVDRYAPPANAVFELGVSAREVSFRLGDSTILTSSLGARLYCESPFPEVLIRALRVDDADRAEWLLIDPLADFATARFEPGCADVSWFMGQSLALGTSGATAQLTGQRYPAHLLMADTQVSIAPSSSPDPVPTIGASEVLALVPAENPASEKPAISFGNAYLRRMARARSEAQDYIVACNAHGGRSITSLKPATTSYTNGTTALSRFTALCAARGRPLRRNRIFWVHGEEDGAMAKATYAGHMNDLFDQLRVDFAVGGMPPVIYMCQPNPVGQPALAMVDKQDGWDYVLMPGLYVGTYVDAVHPDGPTHLHRSDLFAQIVEYREHRGLPWPADVPVSVAFLSSTEVLLTFPDDPFGVGLASDQGLDDALPPVETTPNGLGINIATVAAPTVLLGVDSVTFPEANQALVTLSNPLATSTAHILNYCRKDADPENDARGAYTGTWGNICRPSLEDSAAGRKLHRYMPQWSRTDITPSSF